MVSYDVNVSNRKTVLSTGTKTKILGTSNYLYTMLIYDDKGRVIQSKSTNATGGTDVVTTQYGWQGLPLITVVKTHGRASQPSESLTIVTKNTCDELGRVVKTEKKLSHSGLNGGAMSAWHTLSELAYDALGQVKTKKLAPEFNNNTGLETLDYDYNIRGWLLGANRDYISETTTPDNKHFGFDLGYDKKGVLDYDYLNKQYNGNIGGTIWRSAGDGEKRKYDYSYDAADRLMMAYFGQYNASNKFSNDKLNFNAKMGNGSNPNTAYDANGNIKLMYHYGKRYNPSEPIDKLEYNYEANSNRLVRVDDAFNDPNSTLGDFKYDPLTKTTVDYDYDNNGNLISDANKKITGITYNHLNLPSVITFTVNGTAGPSVKTITYNYDAGGNKLKKITHEDNATISLNGISYPTAITSTVTYLDGAVFESRQYSNSSLASLQFTDELQFIALEEGRIRPVRDANNDITGFTYDYFIKDHLTNVRMVLTEEQQQDIYPLASLESSKVATEEDYYDIQPGNIVDKSEATGITDYPNNNGIPDNPPDPEFEAASSTKLYWLNSTGSKTGLGITLKVMAGDMIDVFGKSYYFQNTAGTEGNSPISVLDLLAGFLGTPLAPGSGHGLTAADINIPSGLYGIQLLLAKQDNKSNAWPTKPRAFINAIFFDEQFKSYDYRVSMAGSANAVKDHYSDLQNIAAEKNGYVYIYCSNESPVDVFFDNLQVVHTRGQMLEEAHYYPYGMKIANISSRAAGTLQNRYLYQGDFSEFDEETGYNEFYLRHYDPQIGRWTTADPYGQFASPYIGMGNSPAGMVDPDGGWGNPFQDFTLNHFLPAMAGAAIGALVTKGDASDKRQGAAWGFGIGMGESYVATGVNWSAVGGALGSAGSWVGGLFQNNDYWILYEGQKAILYRGVYDNLTKSKEKDRFKASSGIVTYKDSGGKVIGNDYRNSEYQFTKVKVNEGGEIKTINVGPIPYGHYSINLSLDPNRKWKLDKFGNSIPGHGIEQIGPDYPEWGTVRARLEIAPGTNTRGRDLFYFHNSTKGYSHGCVETQTGLFNKLYQLRRSGANQIKVRVNYGSTNTSTYGSTDKN